MMILRQSLLSIRLKETCLEDSWEGTAAQWLYSNVTHKNVKFNFV